MNIDEKCNKLILNYSASPYRIKQIKKEGDMSISRMDYWHWHGKPGFISRSQNVTVPKSLDLAIGLLIQEADLAECLTSNSEYIRECKKWFEHNEDYKIKKEKILYYIFKGIKI